NTTPSGVTSPSFAAPLGFATGSNPLAVAVADFNTDGKPDLVVANFNSGTVSVLLNTTAPVATVPSFAPQTTSAVGSSALAVGDFNKDGKPDIAVANSNSVVIPLLNTTDSHASVPSFASQTPLATGDDPASVAAGDFNGDGGLDL